MKGNDLKCIYETRTRCTENSIWFVILFYVLFDNCICSVHRWSQTVLSGLAGTKTWQHAKYSLSFY